MDDPADPSVAAVHSRGGARGLPQAQEAKDEGEEGSPCCGDH